MAYRYGNRYQISLIPPSIEDYVSEDNPVRVYDAFIDSLDFAELGIEINPDRVGNPEYHPKSMFKLLVFGYSYGVKSSRKLERECHNNMSFIWLTGGLRPDHKTIAEFRRRNKGALKRILHQCVKMCMGLDLIEGNVLFVDGTKIRANAGRGSAHGRPYYEKILAEMDDRIRELLADCDAVDRREKGSRSWVKMDRELAKNTDLKEHIREVLSRFESEEKKNVNQTDPDCAIMHSPQGSHPAYNVQSVVDDQHGLIVHAEATSDPNDRLQFAQQVEKANEALGSPCVVACADAGYSDTGELERIDGKDIKVIVPSQRQALHKEEGPFSKNRFVYDPARDCYLCPEGHPLYYSSTHARKGKRHYRMGDSRLCRQCRYFGQCTKARQGRSIIRLRNEEVKLKLEAQYEETSSQIIYARRKTRVEHPFGHIKRNLKTDSFLLRGLEGVKAETSILATCFNVARMITILGVEKLIDKFKEMQMVPAAC